MRRPAILLSLLVPLLAAGCTQSATPSAAPSPAPAAAVTLKGSGQFTDRDTAAIAYDRKLAPAGSQASLTAESRDGRTTSSLVVEGLLPDRKYGAHLHTNPCGAKPDDSGPHFQHHGKSASAANEVWLDLTTDAEGAGRATAHNDWALEPGRLPRALVIHAQPTTSTGPSAGTAGSRVACLTLN
ncbi:superoxide dismutase family protein [Nonomuraea sp. NPDC050790]|uniref:superoxide dismutase family protein n=1 Tax=Nonomuraea sp. NPDC050790 TaxID=3364371 RepID=UPI003792442D